MSFLVVANEKDVINNIHKYLPDADVVSSKKIQKEPNMVKKYDFIVDCTFNDLNNIERTELFDVILPTIKKHNKTFVYNSSAGLYGNKKGCYETDPFEIDQNDFGMIIHSYMETLIKASGVKFVILRVTHIVDLFELNILRAITINAIRNKPIYVSKNSIKNYIHVSDYFKALQTICESDNLTDTTIVNVGSLHEHTNFDIIEMLEDILNKSIPIMVTKDYACICRTPDSLNASYLGFCVSNTKTLKSMLKDIVRSLQ